MRTEIRRIQQALGITAIYVTHDQSEAMSISDKIIIMHKGVIAQIGTPQEIYYHPQSEFVADFIGEANFLKGKCVALEDGCGVLQLADAQVRVAATENMTRWGRLHHRSAAGVCRACSGRQFEVPRGSHCSHGRVSELPRDGWRYAGKAGRLLPCWPPRV